jgi:hypothetical protein
MTKDEAQRSRWTFYEAVKDDCIDFMMPVENKPARRCINREYLFSPVKAFLSFWAFLPALPRGAFWLFHVTFSCPAQGGFSVFKSKRVRVFLDNALD